MVGSVRSLSRSASYLENSGTLSKDGRIRAGFRMILESKIMKQEVIPLAQM